jgi:chemosensory pili system protein ChpA (sensor histidine kinase/response regulator)
MAERAVGGLKWVKGEIAVTLRRVRDLVESVFGAGGETVRLNEAVDALGEVRGVLMALELTLPARLAEEMQRLAEALKEGQVSNPKEAGEALMLALIQLPNHLDRLEFGVELPPLALWPTINDLRETRGAVPLTQAEFLVPGSVLAEDAGSELTREAIDALGGVIRKVRPHFHRHLLEWYRPATSKDGLLNLQRLFHQTHRHLEHAGLADLFRLVAAYGEALEHDQIVDGTAARALIGRLDKVFKPLSRIPAQWPQAQLQGLIDELLNALAHGQVQTAVVAELQRRYGQRDLGELSEGVSEAMAGLAATVLKELASIKERLDLFVRGEHSNRTLLDDIRVSLRELSRTLEVAKAGRLPARLRDLAESFGDLAMSDAGEDTLLLEPLAAELLSIEAVLRAYADRQSPPEGTGAGSGLFATELRTVTLNEIQGELARAKEAILACHELRQDGGTFGELSERLTNVSGALRVLGDAAAGHFADDIAAIVRRRYLAPGQSPSEGEFAMLAGAVAALELHIERLTSGWSHSDDLLAQGRASMSALDKTSREGPEPEPMVTGEASLVGEGTLSEPTPDQVQVKEGTAGRGSGIAEEFMEIFLEEAREETASAVEQLALWRADQGNREALATLRRSFHTLKGSGRLVGAQSVGQLAQAVEGLLNRVLDGSLQPDSDLVVFVAEAVSLLPELVSADSEGRPISVAQEVERADRLAAGHGGERPALAEAVTSEVQTSAQVIPWPGSPGVLEPEVPALSPGEVTAAGSGLENERLEVLEEPIDPQVLETVGSPLPGAHEAVLDDLSAQGDHESQFAADEELLEIFRAETDEHLDTLRSFWEQARVGDGVPGEDAVRALHTLSGSARMAGIDSIAQVAKPLELCLRDHQERGSPLSEGLLDLLARAVGAIEARLAEIPGQARGAAELLALANSIAQIEASAVDVGPAIPRTPEGKESAQSEPESGTIPPVLDAQDQPDERGLSDAAVPSEQSATGCLAEQPEPDAEPVLELPGDADPGTGAMAGTPPPTEPIESPASSGPAVESLATAPLEVLQGEVPGSVAASKTQADELGDEFEAQPADADLRNLFLEDARDLLDRIDEQIREWQLVPADLGVLDGLKRNLHTLKGSARLTGISAIGNLSHALETHLTGAVEAGAEVDDRTLELAQKTADTLSIQIDALERGALIPRAVALVEALSRPLGLGDESTPITDLGVSGATSEAKPVAETLVTSPAAGLASRPESTAKTVQAPQIRVRGDLLNRLVDDAGEIGLYRARLSQRNGLMGFGLGELDQTVTRLREQLRVLELETEAQILYRYERDGNTGADGVLFDPLELDRFSNLQQLSRALAETVNDLVSLRELLWGYQRESADLLNQQARLAEELQDGLLRTRMVPFAQVAPRLHRLVRQTADSLGKSARLEVLGPEVELDRSVLDRLVAPLEHLLRNAVDHGLEGSEARAVAGKPATGMITLVLSREGNDVVISLSDDGRGMDVNAIRRQAIARGLLAPQVELSDEALMQFVFEPGFSTQGRVTQISGRGVGMDVVNSEVKAANGTISIDSVAGRGTSFTIRLPLTLAIIEAFLVGVGDNIYAVPHSTIEGAARIGRDDLATLYRDKAGDFQYRGSTYRVAYLGAVLDPRQGPQVGERRWLPLLLTRVGDLRVAFQVDSLIESNRILVKPLGPQLTGLRWLAGGTILPDGRVALIVDALALLRSGVLQDYLPTAVLRAGTGDAPVCVMVVDDSLTVRRVTARLLRRQSMEVLTAKDGVEALTLLDERKPDIMLLDIEMPRMDGYELTRHVRRSERLKDLPIIMITSRTGDKHRDHAMALGVDRFLGKPYQESELLDEINSALAGRQG